MAEKSASIATAEKAQAPWPPSIRSLVMRHRLASLSLLVVVLAFLSVVVPEVLSAGKLKIGDSTSCSAWSSARPNQKAAYARTYVQVHGRLPGGATNLNSVETAVDYGCIQAFAYDEADMITVLQAIRHQY